MSDTLKIKLLGMEELKNLFDEIVDDYGEKDAKNIMKSAMKDCMAPVQQMAQSLAPVDTGALRMSLRTEARKPTNRDKHSRYVHPTDVVIGTVTTAPGNVLAKRSFYNYSESYKKKKNIRSKGIPSDARANVQEFGSYKMAAHPFMRPAMETQGPIAAQRLGSALGKRLEQYKSKYNK